MPNSETITQSAQAKEICFFHLDGCEFQTLAPIADIARRRGYSIRFSSDLNERVEIGVYCQHACRPNAKHSVIMLHDLAQRHDIWPAFWRHEPWNAFDIGVVPGPTWSERWQSQADLPTAHPKQGVFELGWPKADLIYRSREKFSQEASALRHKLGLIHPQTVLYAPSWENHGKQDDFVRAFIDLPINLLLKQAPWSNDYPAVLENIRLMDEKHRGIAENVHIVDRDISIMYCLGIADAIVSDESSVLTEALLLDVPGIAVMDWLIPDTVPPRFSAVPYDYVTKTHIAELRETVLNILENPEDSLRCTREHRDRHFSCLGSSSEKVMDAIDALVLNTAFPVPPLQANLVEDRTKYQLARKIQEHGDYPVGLGMIFDLASAETACWEVYNHLGILAKREGSEQDAIMLFELAIQHAANPSTPLRNLIELYLTLNRRSDALVSLNRLLPYTLTEPNFDDAMRAFVNLIGQPESTQVFSSPAPILD